MAAAVVADGRPLVVRDLGEVRDHALDRLVGELGPLERGVDLVHVGLVVLVVVDLHGLRVDVGLERVLGVGQVRNLVRHWKSPLSGLRDEPYSPPAGERAPRLPQPGPRYRPLASRETWAAWE